MARNKLDKKFGEEKFKMIFKSITFDNGNEFARFKDIEKNITVKTLELKYILHIHIVHGKEGLMRDIIES